MITNVKIINVIHEINHYKITDDSGTNYFINDRCYNSQIYKQYLAWLAEGNEPLPPDEPEQSEEPSTCAKQII